MKKLTALILLCLYLLSSCAKNNFTDGVKCSELGKSITDTLADGMEYVPFNESRRAMITDDSSDYDDFHHVYSSDSSDINEFGIFHAVNGKADELAENCKEYLEELREDSRAFIASYAPEELPKLDGATVKRFGNYVVYTVLPTDRAEKIFAELEKRLTK